MSCSPERFVVGRGFGVGGRVGSGVDAMVGEGVSGTAVTIGVGVAVGFSVGAGRAVVTHADRPTTAMKTPTNALRVITYLG